MAKKLISFPPNKGNAQQHKNTGRTFPVSRPKSIVYHSFFCHGIHLALERTRTLKILTRPHLPPRPIPSPYIQPTKWLNFIPKDLLKRAQSANRVSMFATKHTKNRFSLNNSIDSQMADEAKTLMNSDTVSTPSSGSTSNIQEVVELPTKEADTQDVQPRFDEEVSSRKSEIWIDLMFCRGKRQRPKNGPTQRQPIIYNGLANPKWSLTKGHNSNRMPMTKHRPGWRESTAM